MSASIRTSPSPPVLPKPEGRRMKSIHTVVSTAEDIELPELREKGTARSKLQLVPLSDQMIPDELLATLTSTTCPRDRLGPQKLSKRKLHVKVHGVRHTDAVWHHPFGRNKYKYFLDQPTSLTGAGRDISFLYDAMVPQRERIPLPPVADRGTSEIQKDMSHMESLIPEEYHIVKNRGVRALEYYDDKFTVLLEDDEKMLKVFPSMRPSGRLEAVQLIKVMDDMLDRAGVNQEYSELADLSQMEGLLELVRVEQNIYNIVFHELIRQVSVECAERGQLLAKLRQRYVDLLDRIPRQLKGLHTETLCQRALDRRLTEEIICFKSSIAMLNTELCKVREHDECVSKQGQRAQEELTRALEQSQKNSDMVAEYHDLYEMQRRRLEAQVIRLTDERDLWSKVTYNLALKVIKLNNLRLASRLHVSEQTWTKTAEHFSAFLTAKDCEDLNKVMQLTDQWKEQLTGFMRRLRAVEHGQCEKIRTIQAGIVKWHTFCSTNNKSADSKFDKTSEEEIYADLKQWSNALTDQCERYGGEELLSGQESLKLLAQLQEDWQEVALQLFRRHPAPDGEPPRGQEAMQQLGAAVSELHVQLGTRINGESGIHKQLMSLVGLMEFWATRLKALIGRSEALPHCDRLKLEKALGGWGALVEEALQRVVSTQPESDRVQHKAHVKVEMDAVFNTLQEFVSTQDNFFDCENRRICEEVSTIHTALTRWMVDLLLQMVPDHCDDQEPAALLPGPHSAALMDVSLEKLEEDAKNLAQKLDYFSMYITSSCQAIVEEEIQKSMAGDDTENELYELNKLQRECGEWVEACKILLSDVKGSPVDLRVTLNVVPTSVTDILPSPAASVESLVHADASTEVVEHVEEHGSQVQITEDSRPTVQQGEPSSSEEAVEEEPQGGSIMKLIGHDGNIMERPLGDRTVQLEGTEEMVVCPQTANAHKAFDALSTVGVLQNELLAVEVRAQSAEVRALKAEEALQAALEKIQDLERQQQGRPSLKPKVSKRSVVAASPCPKKASTPEPRPASQKPEPSPKLSKLKKR